jgi:integrase
VDKIILDRVDDDTQKAVVTTAAFTGLSLSELRGLRWESVSMRKLLANATPYIQEIAVFALNTGLRIGEILSLSLERVDLEKNLLSMFAHKTHKIRPVPINAGARRVPGILGFGQKERVCFL